MKETSMKIYMIQKITDGWQGGRFESGKHFLFKPNGKVWRRKSGAATHIKLRLKRNCRNEVEEYKKCALVEIELHFNMNSKNEVLQIGALVVKKYRIVYDDNKKYPYVTFEPMF